MVVRVVRAIGQEVSVGRVLRKAVKANPTLAARLCLAVRVAWVDLSVFSESSVDSVSNGSMNLFV